MKYDFSNQKKRNDVLYSVLCHDLMSPVSAINQLTKITLDNFDEYSKDELSIVLNAINQTSDSIQNLLNNMLKYSIHTNDLSFKLLEWNLNEIINEVLNVIFININHKNIEIINNIPNSLNIVADINTLSSVFRNILINAVKFSYENSKIEINVMDYNLQIVVEIKDYGVGMSKETLNKLLKSNVSSKFGTNNEKGHGIGLLLCKELMELNNGSIWIESELGKGTSFFIEIKKNNYYTNLKD